MQVGVFNFSQEEKKNLHRMIVKSKGEISNLSQEEIEEFVRIIVKAEGQAQEAVEKFNLKVEEQMKAIVGPSDSDPSSDK